MTNFEGFVLIGLAAIVFVQVITVFGIAGSLGPIEGLLRERR